MTDGDRPTNLARALALLLWLGRLAVVVAALGAIGYGMEGIRPRLGYLAVGVLVWLELRTIGRRPKGGPDS